MSKKLIGLLVAGAILIGLYYLVHGTFTDLDKIWETPLNQMKFGDFILGLGIFGSLLFGWGSYYNDEEPEEKKEPEAPHCSRCCPYAEEDETENDEPPCCNGNCMCNERVFTG